ncbi:MAG TPA: methyltransferase domain-containing protein [Candidatus Polarisedimenticolia bacterium]
MPLTEADLSLLACPRCRGDVRQGDGSLRCTRCTAVYEVREGIPDLLPWSGGVPGPEWARWREKLDALGEWRRATWDGSASSVARQKVADDLAGEFFKFARIPESATVLEIGCGSGELIRYLPRRRYWGLDPAPLSAALPPPAAGSPGPVLVRGVGEKLPLADGVFEAVLLCETLDHALDPVQVIREARRVLKGGGVMAVMQGVALAMPPPPLRVRLRAAAGRVKARLLGRSVPADADTKMHVITQDGLTAIASAELLVESGITRGQTMFLRALKQDLSAPRVPKRSV